MHIIFSPEELKWIDTSKFGWPIKENCPENIRKIITDKLDKLNKQEMDYAKG